MGLQDGPVQVGDEGVREVPVEVGIERIATQAHGVVTRQELLAAGISSKEIRDRLQRGALLRVYRGVYRVGHRAPSLEAHYTAAVKACGPGAFLSGPAAGHLLGLLNARPPIPEVTAPAKRRARGVRARRSRHVDERDVMRRRGIRVSTAPRTVVDLAASLNAENLARACHEAQIRYRTTPVQVLEVLDRRPTSRGAKQLRRIMFGDLPVTLSRLESRFLERLRHAGLPMPQTNRLVGSHRVDCRWPEQRLTVELDSYRYHHSRHAWELDRRREREAHSRGDDFRRYTYGDVLDRPEQMLAELRALLIGPEAVRA